MWSDFTDIYQVDFISRNLALNINLSSARLVWRGAKLLARQLACSALLLVRTSFTNTVTCKWYTIRSLTAHEFEEYISYTCSQSCYIVHGYQQDRMTFMQQKISRSFALEFKDLLLVLTHKPLLMSMFRNLSKEKYWYCSQDVQWLKFLIWFHKGPCQAEQLGLQNYQTFFHRSPLTLWSIYPLVVISFSILLPSAQYQILFDLPPLWSAVRATMWANVFQNTSQSTIWVFVNNCPMLWIKSPVVRPHGERWEGQRHSLW